MRYGEYPSVSRVRENLKHGLTGRGWKPGHGLSSEALRNRKGGAIDRTNLQIGRQPFTLLPLLAEIVTNTLNTLYELQRQTGLLKDEMAGINDKIYRIQTISQVVQPSSWDQWKDPSEAVRRLERIYYTLPKEYRSEKSDEIEAEISKAMNMVARLTPETQNTFRSGKELEQRGTDASPGVAQKLTASGVGTLVAMESQSQALQSQIASLLAQMLASANERESRQLVSSGQSFSSVSESLGNADSRFSSHILLMRIGQ